MEKAERLYCCSGHSLRGMAEHTGVPLRTLKRWSGKNGWGEKKSEFGKGYDRDPDSARGSYNRYPSSIMMDRSGIKMAPSRYHSGTIPAPSRHHKSTNGLNVVAGLHLQQARLLKFFEN